MRRFNPADLPDATLKKLLDLQSDVDAMVDYPNRVAKAKILFALRNKKTDPTFSIIRRTLEAAVGASNRCVYCEDSEANEVEHVAPKSFYPDKAFVWDNYVWACGLCNGPKNNNFAIFDAAGHFHELRRDRKVPPVEPPPGTPVAIDPRKEDAADFLYIDLQTGVVAPQIGLNATDKRRAEYTIELYQLERRAAVRKARHNAVRDFLNRLRYYAAERDRGVPPSLLDHVRDEILNLPHQSVWDQMKQCRDVHKSLREVFLKVPEALSW